MEGSSFHLCTGCDIKINVGVAPLLMAVAGVTQVLGEPVVVVVTNNNAKEGHYYPRSRMCLKSCNI